MSCSIPADSITRSSLTLVCKPPHDSQLPTLLGGLPVWVGAIAVVQRYDAMATAETTFKAG